ncbi:hypothetical protein ASD02_32415 [Ensifer sp. Root1252]|jgi:hypothetical protein|nr:hypothetical protein ASD02_32415 [Ensifer sp. Root1252]KRC54284.1 hypothetical protein ASE32_22465 [Ensifer sp. Root231]KRD01618.1 hypothetical protein ASE47_21840 [Ensifer sp. Root258]
MQRSILYLMPIFAMSWAVSGCSQTSGATDGAGYAMLTPSGATRQFMIANDQPFARQVASHNRMCAAHAGCSK